MWGRNEKDTWLYENLPQWPTISLDAIRKELHISPEETQGQVVQLAKERARQFMRQHQSFVRKKRMAIRKAMIP